MSVALARGRRDENSPAAWQRVLDQLDSVFAERFNRLARKAAATSAMPVALVVLIDSERRWIKSGVGLSNEQEVSVAALCRAASDSIVGHRAALIGHCLDGARGSWQGLLGGTADDALSKRANAAEIGCFVGVPLLLDADVAVGLLCVMDRRGDRPLPAVSALQAVAAEVVAELMADADEPTAADADSVLRLDVTRAGSGLLIRFRGALRYPAASRWSDLVLDALASAPDAASLQIDLHGCEAIDSSGLGAVVRIMKHCRRAGLELSLTDAPARVDKVFRQIGLAGALTQGARASAS